MISNGQERANHLYLLPGSGSRHQNKSLSENRFILVPEQKCQHRAHGTTATASTRTRYDQDFVTSCAFFLMPPKDIGNTVNNDGRETTSFPGSLLFTSRTRLGAKWQIRT